MSPAISLTSTQVLLLAFAVIAVVIAIIAAGKTTLARRAKSDLTLKHKDTKWASPLDARVKYPEVDILRHSSTFTLVGLVLVLTMLVGLFGWTTYEEAFDIPVLDMSVVEDVIVEPPRTAEPPPPPPPPPPPVIEEVPDEMLLEDEDDIEFMDQSIDAEAMIEAPKADPDAGEGDEPPPPPPPPPPMDEPEEIFKVVEEMPRFPGCEDLGGTMDEKKTCANRKLYEFIYKYIQYPALARENNIQGNAVISFVVNSDGSIEQIQVLRDPGAGCGDEAARVIKLMNEKDIRWTPGKQRGKPVRVQFILPIKFQLA